MARRRASAAQLRARAAFARMARSGIFKRRRNPKKKKRGGGWAFGPGEHRPRVHISRGRSLETFRPKSPYKHVIKRVNPKRRRRNQPTQGAPAMITNRRRRKRSRARARRRNPVFFNPRRRRSHKRRRHSARRRNPILFNKRRHRARRRRNPSMAASVRGMLNKQFIINSILAAAGFGAGMKASSLVGRIPGVGALGKFKGIVHILLGSLAVMYAKRPALRSLAGGFAAAGAYDLLAQNVPMLKLPSLTTASVAGDEGIVVGDWDEGQNALGVDFRGVDFQHGDDGGAALVGASGSSYNSSY